MRADIRSFPDTAFIASVRARYPVETEIDRVLTRKLSRRGSGAYDPVPLASLVAGCRSLIESSTKSKAALSHARWMSGGASKLQMAFDLELASEDEVASPGKPMVLRMETPEAIVTTSRRREFAALEAMHDVVPVPRCHWIDPDGLYLPYPALIYSFSPGVTKPTGRPSHQGAGIDFGPELRSALAPQFVDHLAAIHRADVRKLGDGDIFDPVDIGSSAGIIRQINWWRRVWEEDRLEANPLVEVATRWLLDNAPLLDRVSLIHGDYRSGNFLFDESDGRITAWLDWELAVLGDRHLDLAWATGLHFGSLDGSGQFLAAHLLPIDEFFERYEKTSGLSVDPARLRYYRVFNGLASSVTMLATAGRIARSSKTHQDIVIAWVSMIGAVIIDELRELLEELI